MNMWTARSPGCQV